MTELASLTLADLDVVKNALQERFFRYPDSIPQQAKDTLRLKIRLVEDEITTKVNQIKYPEI